MDFVFWGMFDMFFDFQLNTGFLGVGRALKSFLDVARFILPEYELVPSRPGPLQLQIYMICLIFVSKIPLWTALETLFHNNLRFA